MAIGGSFKHLPFSPDPWGNDPICLGHMFHAGVGSITN